MSGYIFLIVVCSFVVSVGATFLVRFWARLAGFEDRPGGHKRHGRPIVLGGGIAILGSIGGTLLLGTAVIWAVSDGPPPSWLPSFLHPHMEGIASKLPTLLAILAGAAVLHVVGLIDDCKPLGPWPKLAMQVAVALFTAWTMGIRAVEALPAPISIAVTVLWIVVITNAFNFLDNMDGLSAGVAAITAAIFAVAAMRVGQVFVPAMALVMVGTLLGYLVFNFPPASIFMGDAGSLVVGYLMAVLAILTTFYNPTQGLTPLGVLVPIVILAVPLYDMMSVIYHRVRLGESPLRGDQRHFSHRLIKRGMSDRGALLTIYLATAATGLPAIVLATVGWAVATLLLTQCLCVVIMIAILEHAGPVTEEPE